MIRFVALSGLLLFSALGDDYFPPPDREGGWRTLASAASIRKLAGIDTGRLDQAFQFIQETSQHGGLVVVRHGYLVYEKYFGKGNREAHPDMASIGKAFTSISCGILLEEKRDQIPEGLETKVFTEKYLPEAFPLSATDAVRFAYLLLHKGRWGNRQLAPADYVAMCGRPSPYNPHSPFSLMFEVNQDGHVFGAPRDAFFKSGAGGSAIYVIPSLDMVVYKMAGSDAQFNPELTGLPLTYAVDHSRDNWKPLPHDAQILVWGGAGGFGFACRERRKAKKKAGETACPTPNVMTVVSI